MARRSKKTGLPPGEGLDQDAPQGFEKLPRAVREALLQALQEGDVAQARRLLAYRGPDPDTPFSLSCPQCGGGLRAVGAGFRCGTAGCGFVSREPVYPLPCPQCGGPRFCVRGQITCRRCERRWPQPQQQLPAGGG